jgi:putative nucleotidyltransferase with HDIG domain
LVLPRSTEKLIGETLGSFVSSKVGRRIVVLFVSCALLPIVCLALVGYVQVTGQLRADGQRRLRQASKSAGMELHDRLMRLEADLQSIDVIVPTMNDRVPVAVPARLRVRLAQHFVTVAGISEHGYAQAIVGTLPSLPEPAPAERTHLREGKTLLTVHAAAGDAPRVFMRRVLGPPGSNRLLAAEVNQKFLWDRDLLPPGMELHVLGASQEQMFTSFAGGVQIGPNALRLLAGSHAGDFQWEDDGHAFLASYWTLPLAFDFKGPQWTLVASASSSDVLAPMDRAAFMFGLVALLSLWVVMLLSLVQVRRSMVPLTRLQEGTRRIGLGDFESDVSVTSGDEFEELAGSFNAMSRRLKRQFDTLSVLGELDRAVLSSLDVDTIVRTALDRLPQLLGDAHLGIVLLASGHHPARAFLKRGRYGAPLEVLQAPVLTQDVQMLLGHSDGLRLERRSDVPGFLTVLRETSWRACLVLPLVLDGRIAGMLLLAEQADGERAEDLPLMRQFANQLAVALSNARLMEALDRMNVGTLNALARTVDAKSPWTSGHSQRVTEMALEIGRTLGLAPDGLDIIARGGLLHDIGKIAVPSAILDKPGPLTTEEFAIMREHPRTGARILEPIPEYSRLIPVVLHHHERFDGHGYPDGIAGEAITIETRIMSVADVFDALTSERPYRASMPGDRAMRIILEGSGTQFDPEMVRALEAVRARTPVIPVGTAA